MVLSQNALAFDLFERERSFDSKQNVMLQLRCFDSKQETILQLCVLYYNCFVYSCYQLNQTQSKTVDIQNTR